MTTIRANVRRNGEDNVDQEVPHQAPIHHLEEKVTNEKFRFGVQMLAQVGIETLEFYGSKIEEDPQEFIDKVSKVLDFVGATPVEKAELDSYQLNGVAQVWFNQWKDTRPIGMGPIEWERFKSAFLDRNRQRSSGQDYSNVPKYNDDRVSSPKSQGISNESLWPFRARFDRRHVGKCLAGSNVCFGCGELVHKIRHCPTVARNEGNSRRRSQPYLSSGPICSGVNAPKQIRFYAL
ncbi:uncharacterized protein LOC125859071 [Solanum stenotomum]|uniref:uncharacterized protein LOC125859071 n=1 Tax=Solanum stenotomum TaxID=172797 RepID=UPI0020D0EE03|nr:uncharacterized protein LOC125859071 [Solanum stenotomum]